MGGRVGIHQKNQGVNILPIQSLPIERGGGVTDGDKRLVGKLGGRLPGMRQRDSLSQPGGSKILPTQKLLKKAFPVLAFLQRQTAHEALKQGGRAIPRHFTVDSASFQGGGEGPGIHDGLFGIADASLKPNPVFLGPGVQFVRVETEFSTRTHGAQ